MSADSQSKRNAPELSTGALITAAGLIGGGAMLALAGLAIGSAHLFSATRRWVQEMDVPPSEVAKLKWTQARTAAAAGTAAWRNGEPTGVNS